jgi:large subunit ribosomal protein L9
MKVLLREDVDNVGYAGEIHTVADGYGRNYLIPKGMAVLATSGQMKQAEAWRRKAEARREEMRAEYEALSQKIQTLRLSYVARAGETGKLYGSITTTQITDDMNELLGTDIDRRKVGVEPLRQLGEHPVIVRLSAEFQPHLTVVIEPEEGSPALAALGAQAAAAAEMVDEAAEAFEEEIEDEIEAEFEEEIEEEFEEDLEEDFEEDFDDDIYEDEIDDLMDALADE